MKKKAIMAGLAALCVACSAAGFAACKPEEPEVQEGVIYQTGVETFWGASGKHIFPLKTAKASRLFTSMSIPATGMRLGSRANGRWKKTALSR